MESFILFRIQNVKNLIMGFNRQHADSFAMHFSIIKTAPTDIHKKHMKPIFNTQSTILRVNEIFKIKKIWKQYDFYTSVIPIYIITDD